jgi:plastocyanin
MGRRSYPSGARASAVGSLMAMVMVFGLLAIALSGCSAVAGQKSMTAGAPAKQANSMMSGVGTDPSVPSCYECSGKGKPPVTKGTATMQDGVQVVNVRVVNGYYSPNKITVTAGTPVKVTFAGKTKDCVGKPKFGSLGKQVDIRKTGTGTIDLGPLDPGTYTFSCGMDVNQGTITAQ